MPRTDQITTLNWRRLKAFASPFEQNINDALDSVLSLAESHQDCPGPILVSQVLDRVGNVATQLQGTLDHITPPISHRAQQQPASQNQGKSAQLPPSSRTRAQTTLAMLQYLHDNDGQATATAIYQHVQGMDPPLNESDLEMNKSGTPRWKRDVEKIRQSLAARQLIRKGTPTYTWVLTQQGETELQHLLTLAQPEPRPEPEPQPEPNHTSSHTPQSQYRLPILQYLTRRGGSAKTQEVIAHIGKTMTRSFNAADLQPTPKGHLRWHAIVNNARLQLARNGLLRTDSPAGTWEISQEGRRYVHRAKAPPRDITTPSSRLARAQVKPTKAKSRTAADPRHTNTAPNHRQTAPRQEKNINTP